MAKPDSQVSSANAGNAGTAGTAGAAGVKSSGSSDKANADTASLVDAARNKPLHVEIGQDRAIGAVPNWDAQDSNALYQGATVNNDPASAEAIGQAWQQHGNELHKAASDLYDAIAELGSAWTGQGASAAQGTLVAIASSSSQAGEAALSMSTKLSQQAAAAAEVKKMPAPKQFDPAASVAAMLAGGPAAMIADQKAQFDAANAVKAQQVAYLNTYTQAMSEVDSATPSFGPEALGLPKGDTQAGAAPAAVGVGGMGSVDTSAVATPGALAGSSAGAATAGASTASGHQPDFQAASASSTASGTAAGSGSGSSAGSNNTAGVASGGGLGSQLALGALGGGLGFAAAKTLNAGNRSASVKQQPGDTAAAANSGNQSAAANSAPAVAPVAPKNVVSSNGLIGAPGMMPPPMMGAGVQQSQDEEHRSPSFLIEPDPDTTFGAVEATPPPVIGAEGWPADQEDEAR